MYKKNILKICKYVYGDIKGLLLFFMISIVNFIIGVRLPTQSFLGDLSTATYLSTNVVFIEIPLILYVLSKIFMGIVNSSILELLPHQLSTYFRNFYMIVIRSSIIVSGGGLTIIIILYNYLVCKNVTMGIVMMVVTINFYVKFWIKLYRDTKAKKYYKYTISMNIEDIDYGFDKFEPNFSTASKEGCTKVRYDKKFSSHNMITGIPFIKYK